jgi:hypothetical protein
VKESQGPELQDNRKLRPPSPPALDSQGPEIHDKNECRPLSPPARDSQGPELQDKNEHSPSSPPARDSKGPELRPSSPTQVLELQDTKRKRSASPPPPKERELHDTTGNSPPPPPAQVLHLHPSTEQPELMPNTDRETHKPLPSTQHPVFEAAKDSSSSGFFVFWTQSSKH